MNPREHSHRPIQIPSQKNSYTHLLKYIVCEKILPTTEKSPRPKMNAF